MTNIDLFVFASKNLTNIWAGIGSGTWAISKRDKSSAKAILTKSKRMKVGSIGVLYCTETHSLTTPFVVYSEPDPDREIDNIWSDAEPWTFPFRIHPLGSPRHQMEFSEAMVTLPTLKNSSNRNFSQVFNVTATTVFVPKIVTPEDWAILIAKLAVT